MVKTMNKIEKLIDELCPEGVEFRELGEIANIKNGKDWKMLNSGDVPVYGTGGIMCYVDKFSYNHPTVLIPRKGSIENIFYLEEPFWNVDTIYYTEIDIESIIPKYFYYFLKTIDLKRLDTGSGRPSLTQAILNRIKVPIPPLAIQEEIVKILDNFTKLEAELEAELEARKKQYEYYREELLTFGDDVEWVKLMNISTNLDSKRKPVSRSARQKGKYPYYGASGIVDYVSEYIFDGHYLLISEDGANLLARKTPIAFSVSGKSWVNNHAHILKFDDLVIQKYVEIYLNSINLTEYISGAAQPKLNQRNLNSIEIPYPAFECRERIVTILDKFDALVNDISTGLPAEIAARKKQYEYYRNQLLTFKPLEKQDVN